MWAAISAIGSVSGLLALGVHAYLGWRKLRNSPAIESNVEAGKVQVERDAAARAVLNPDQSQLNHDLSP